MVSVIELTFSFIEIVMQELSAVDAFMMVKQSLKLWDVNSSSYIELAASLGVDALPLCWKPATSTSMYPLGNLDDENDNKNEHKRQ